MINWHELPPEFKWAAMDSDGSWFAYSEEPIIDHDEGYWAFRSGAGFTEDKCIPIPAPIDWKTTMNRRPIPEGLDNLFKL